MPKPPAEHGTPSRWRAGCHCDACTAAHNSELRQLRRAAAVERLAPVAQALLDDIAAGVRLPDACRIHQVTLAQVQGRARWDATWRARLDAALMVGRDPHIEHGTESGYRHHHCLCPQCRAAHRR